MKKGNKISKVIGLCRYHNKAKAVRSLLKLSRCCTIYLLYGRGAFISFSPTRCNISRALLFTGAKWQKKMVLHECQNFQKKIQKITVGNNH